MKLAIAAVLVCSLPALAQDTKSGVSNPPPESQADTQQAAPSSNAGYPTGYRPTPLAPETGTRRVLRSDTKPADTTPADNQPALAGTPVPPDAPMDYVATGNQSTSYPKIKPTDADAQIVSGPVSTNPNELPLGSMLHVRMHETLSTETTRPGTPFTASVTEPMLLNGRTLIPAGSTLEGHVTEVRGGRRIHGTAALHLEPRRLVLPDGSNYLIHAQVIDSSQSFATRIDTEGTIYRRDHIKATLGVLGATTGTAAVAGAMIGGGVGAAVGAGVGAGLGAAWWLKQDRQTVLPKDTNLIFSLNEPMTIGHQAQ